MRYQWLLLVVGLLFLTARVAHGDSIKVGNTVYENVYIVKSPTGYYVSMPQDGTVLKVDAGDVDAKSVVITEDKDARKALYEKWRQQNEKRKGISPSDDVSGASESTAQNADAAKSEARAEDGAKHHSPDTLSLSGEGKYDDYQMELESRSMRQKSAMIDARRRQNELTKYKTLMTQKLITSQDAGGGMGGSGSMSGNMIGSNIGGYGR